MSLIEPQPDRAFGCGRIHNLAVLSDFQLIGGYQPAGGLADFFHPLLPSIWPQLPGHLARANAGTRLPITQQLKDGRLHSGPARTRLVLAARIRAIPHFRPALRPFFAPGDGATASAADFTRLHRTRLQNYARLNFRQSLILRRPRPASSPPPPRDGNCPRPPSHSQ